MASLRTTNKERICAFCDGDIHKGNEYVKTSKSDYHPECWTHFKAGFKDPMDMQMQESALEDVVVVQEPPPETAEEHDARMKARQDKMRK